MHEDFRFDVITCSKPFNVILSYHLPIEMHELPHKQTNNTNEQTNKQATKQQILDIPNVGV